ncbi:MAG: hypothetical protein AAF567_12455 [Actinomycetota bacterium]
MRFDETDLREAATIERVSPDQFQMVHGRITADLRYGRDAWPAVSWLAATQDPEAKERMIREVGAELQSASAALLSVDGAVDNFGSEIVFGRAAQHRRRARRAFDFATALHRSLHPDEASGAYDLSFEDIVSRREQASAMHDAQTAALPRMGLQPGSGVPFYDLYMRRRRHKSWG